MTIFCYMGFILTDRLIKVHYMVQFKGTSRYCKQTVTANRNGVIRKTLEVYVASNKYIPYFLFCNIIN